MKKYLVVLNYFLIFLGAVLLIYSIIMNFNQTMPILLNPVFPRSDWPNWATPAPRMDPPILFTEWHDYIRFTFLGALLVLYGVNSAKRRALWIPLLIIGLISVLSFSGQYLDMRKYWDINKYVFLGSQADFRNYLMDYVTRLLPGVACIIGSILLKMRKDVSVTVSKSAS